MTAETHTPEGRPWSVKYRGHMLHLTTAEYLALKAAALDDLAEAERLALEHLARQAKP